MRAYSECVGMPNKESEEYQEVVRRGGDSVKLLNEKEKEEGMDKFDMECLT